MRYRKTKGYKYQLAAFERVRVDLPNTPISHPLLRIKNGVLTVKKYYAWDGSSIPMKRWVPERLWDFDKYCKRASLFHDALCQLMREGLLVRNRPFKKYIDGLYRYMCIEGGMSKWTANLRYNALRKHGDPYIKAGSDKRGTVFEI